MLILGWGRFLVFAFGVFGRSRSCLSFGVFLLSWWANTRIALLGCMLCLLLCGIGVVVVGVLFFPVLV